MIVGILALVFGIIIVILATFISDKTDGSRLFFVIIGLGFICAGMYVLSFDKGEEYGAYNQLRCKYKIAYTFDKDSCVNDTIIIFNQP